MLNRRRLIWIHMVHRERRCFVRQRESQRMRTNAGILLFGCCQRMPGHHSPAPRFIMKNHVIAGHEVQSVWTPVSVGSYWLPRPLRRCSVGTLSGALPFIGAAHWPYYHYDATRMSVRVVAVARLLSLSQRIFARRAVLSNTNHQQQSTTITTSKWSINNQQ